MPQRLHFISGLPRSGSTLLAAILRQNPRFHATISTPLAELILPVLKAMSASERSSLISVPQRERIVRAMTEAYYAELSGKVVFDTNRSWCRVLPLITELFPASRVICCLRCPAWIIDSVERAVQRNPLFTSRMFNNEVSNVYQRAEAMAKRHFLWPSLSALKQAWYSEHAGRLVAIRYDAITEHPEAVVASLYRELGEPPFVHDFEHLDYDEPEFDAYLGMPGMHKVATRVTPTTRATILPPDLFQQYDESFWETPGGNPRSVTIL
jgi:sulfotransferase